MLLNITEDHVLLAASSLAYFPGITDLGKSGPVLFWGCISIHMMAGSRRYQATKLVSSVDISERGMGSNRNIL